MAGTHKNAYQIFKIGHSTRSLKGFFAFLKEYDITYLVDVRTIPRSRHNPQFNKETLPAELALNNVHYRHLSGLGGLWKTRLDSINTNWRNASFRGFAGLYADLPIQGGVKETLIFGQDAAVAITCAEAVRWRCHRSLIADALTVRGWEVRHIMSLKNAHLHKLTPWLTTKGKRIWYPPDNTDDSQKSKQRARAKKITGKLLPKS